MGKYDTVENQIPIVDDWTPNADDIIFTNRKDLIIAPIYMIYHMEDAANSINMFSIKPKKSYNSDLLRDHTCHYLNYFEKFFDPEKEYLTNIAYLKFMVDNFNDYNMQNLIYDLNRYILQPSIYGKIDRMVERNYSLVLMYKSRNNPQLQYTDHHAKVLMTISIAMNMIIPIITHFAYKHKIGDIDEYLLDYYDYILYAPQFHDVDIAAKLYETSVSNVSRNVKNNPIIWSMQDIRGKDMVTHSEGAVRNIIINIIPKYTFSQNMISLNYTSIQKSNKFQITDIQYEFNYIPLSSSRREGEDNASDFDRFEANLTKADESLYLQNEINYQYSMRKIEDKFGPFDPKEVAFYRKELTDENHEIINNFQKQLIFNLFYKYFGDTTSINAINGDDYIKLMIAARKMLKDNMLAILPYVVSSKVNKVVSRKNLNKKELLEMEADQNYPLVVEKYKNQKVLHQILGTIATIITSSFTAIDYHDKELNGLPIHIDSKFIIKETLLYVLLI